MNTMTRLIRSAAILLVVALSLPVAMAETGSRTIVVMGDSLSAAHGIEVKDGWVALLDRKLDSAGFSRWSVVNASVGGETSDGGLRRIDDVLERTSPEILILELGGNDGLRGFPPQVLNSNLETMIEKSQKAGAQVLLVGMLMPPNFGPAYTDAFAAVYSDLATEHDLPFVEFFLANVYGQAGMMQEDGIHPSTEAQPQLLRNVWPALKPMLTRDDAMASAH